MQVLAEQPKTLEKQRSFDIVANVNLMQFDLQIFGQVLPETRTRVLDEQLSFLAEGIDKASCTTFVLKRGEDGDMRYFDRGNWRPYGAMLQTGLQVAEAEAAADPRKQFLAGWATQNLYQGYRMRTLEPGEQFVWHSSYPYDVEAIHGEKFLQQCGLQADRKMGFIYLARAREDGAIVLQSQTVDRSDESAFAAVQMQAEENPQAGMDDLRDEYDRVLEQKYGEKFYAGRLDAELLENAYTEILKHQDLVNYDMEQLENIAKADVTPERREHMTKKHLYGVWALFKKRIEGLATPVNFWSGNSSSMPSLAFQVDVAFREFAVARKVMAACGGSLEAEEDRLTILNASVEEVFNQIFHNATELFTSVIGKEYYSYDELHFCDECQAPPSEEDLENNDMKWCGPCGYCEPCDTKLRVAV